MLSLNKVLGFFKSANLFRTQAIFCPNFTGISILEELQTFQILQFCCFLLILTANLTKAARKMLQQATHGN